MNRRQFLSSLAAFGLTPALRLPAFAGTAAIPASSNAVPAATYKWAETIVRAHNKCNLGMLERLLGLDPATAASLKSELLKNGVISSTKSAYGMHTAVKPLYTELFPQAKSTAEKLANKAAEQIEELLEEETELGDLDETAEADQPTTHEISSQLTNGEIAENEEEEEPENPGTESSHRKES